MFQKFLKQVSGDLAEQTTMNLNANLEEKISPKLANILFNVIIRTQGLRNELLDEALTSLKNQICRDFRVVVVIQTEDEEIFRNTNVLVKKFNNEFLHEIIILQNKNRGRTNPLNQALKNLDAELVVFLDDDDLVLDNWLSNFSEAYCKEQDSIIRCFAFGKLNSQSSLDNLDLYSESDFQYEWNLSEHLEFNRTPIHTIAIPISALNFFGIKFDESLTTNEDWDFLLSATRYLGVKDTKVFTAIYRQWEQNSAVTVDANEWEKNRNQIREKYESSIYLTQGNELRKYYSKQLELENLVAQVKWDYADLLKERDHLHNLIVEFKDSISFKITKPIRIIGSIIYKIKSLLSITLK